MAEVASPIGPPQAVTARPDSAWLKDPLDPTRNRPVSCLGPVVPVRERTQAILVPLGAKYPIVQTDTRRARTVPLEFTPLDQAAADALDAALDSGRVLLLQRPSLDPSWAGLQLYFVATGPDTATPVAAGHDATTVTVAATEVRRPPDPIA